MNVHQILTGALNRGDEVFSVGAIDDLSFTVCNFFTAFYCKARLNIYLTAVF